jgi:hypothetical protein
MSRQPAVLMSPTVNGDGGIGLEACDRSASANAKASIAGHYRMRQKWHHLSIKCNETERKFGLCID